MWNEIGIAFQIMGKGMLGIFAVIIIIMFLVMLMQKISKKVSS